MVEKKCFLVGLTAGVANAIALGLLVTSFATTYWVIYDVTSDTLTGDSRWHFSHHKGLMWICFDGLKPDACFNVEGYEVGDWSTSTTSSNWTTNYRLHVHMLRAVFMCDVIAMLLIALQGCVGVFACVTTYKMALQISSSLGVLGGLLVGAAMALYHVVNNLEGDKLDEYEQYPAGRSESLRDLTSVKLGVSVIFGWAAMMFALISAVFHMWTAMEMVDTENNRKGMKDSDEDSSLDPSMSRNRAYDIEYVPEPVSPNKEGSLPAGDYVSQVDDSDHDEIENSLCEVTARPGKYQIPDSPNNNTKYNPPHEPEKLKVNSSRHHERF